MPSLKRLTLQGSKIDFHAFPIAPNLEELDVLDCRCPRIGQHNSFPNLKNLHITYPTKYPLSSVPLAQFSLRNIQTLVIKGDVELANRSIEGTYPSLSKLEFTKRVPRDIEYMSAPSLRHLILRSADLFCLHYPLSSDESEVENARQKNTELLKMLAGSFPTVQVLEIHENLRNLVLLEMVSGEAEFFGGLKELWFKEL